MSRFRYAALILVLIVVVSGCAGTATTPTATRPPATQPEPTAAAPVVAETAITVNGQPFTLDEVQALEQIDVESDGASYTGVPMEMLLAQAGVGDDGAKLIFVGEDGYQAQVSWLEVYECPDCIVAFQDQGGFRVVMPGFTGQVQVRDLVEIQVLDAVAALPEAPEGRDDPIPNDGPVTVVDSAGRTVELDALPRRIVVVGRAPYMTLHLLYMFPEGRVRLIGAESKGATPSDFLPFVDPDFVNIVSLAANPGPEQIVALEPDLVLMKSIVMEQMGESLAQVGVPVVYTGLETPEQFFQDVTNLGALLGNPARATEIIEFYQSRLNRITQTVADVPDEDKPRVLLLEYSDRGGEVAVQVPAQSWMQTIQVQAAGGNPAWLEAAEMTDGWTVVNFEQIAVWNPDQVFVVVWYTLDPAEVVATLKADPQWSKLQAIQNEQVYAFPSDIFGWDTPEPRWILGTTWLATRIYPDLFSDLDVTEEMITFFGQMYNMEQSDIEAHILPKAHLDVH
ncbi:MAG: ABC transporter substrate-binding protein [Chloroflexota bacterium]|nr:ABC transporter substrate-binding protein [Chloroflexota bacterium]